jgi:hypothetical protein
LLGRLAERPPPQKSNCDIRTVRPLISQGLRESRITLRFIRATHQEAGGHHPKAGDPVSRAVRGAMAAYDQNGGRSIE